MIYADSKLNLQLPAGQVQMGFDSHLSQDICFPRLFDTFAALLFQNISDDVIGSSAGNDGYLLLSLHRRKRRFFLFGFPLHHRPVIHISEKHSHAVFAESWIVFPRKTLTAHFLQFFRFVIVDAGNRIPFAAASLHHGGNFIAPAFVVIDIQANDFIGTAVYLLSLSISSRHRELLYLASCQHILWVLSVCQPSQPLAGPGRK